MSRLALALALIAALAALTPTATPAHAGGACSELVNYMTIDEFTAHPRVVVLANADRGDSELIAIQSIRFEPMINVGISLDGGRTQPWDWTNPAPSGTVAFGLFRIHTDEPVSFTMTVTDDCGTHVLQPVVLPALDPPTRSIPRCAINTQVAVAAGGKQFLARFHTVSDIQITGVRLMTMERATIAFPDQPPLTEVGRVYNLPGDSITQDVIMILDIEPHQTGGVLLGIVTTCGEIQNVTVAGSAP